MTANPFEQAIHALDSGDRRAAAGLVGQMLQKGPPSGEGWLNVARLAAHIGELTLELEAMRRYAVTEPHTLDRILPYAHRLANCNRADEALTIAEDLPGDHPAVRHLRASLAAQGGDIAGAEAIYRQALTLMPDMPMIWASLAEVKTFTADDPDMARMEALKSAIAHAPPEVQAPFLYALAKAHDDAGDAVRAAALYSEGAVLMRNPGDTEIADYARMADRLITGFTPGALTKLKPSASHSDRVIFVNGLPRSGTTLAQQILSSHSTVAGGGELNLIPAALIPTRDYSLSGALALQEYSKETDPWGGLAADYLHMIADRFGPEGRVIDKTPNYGRYMGLLLHILPNARVIWMRRNPDDTALSCFRTFFSDSVPWSWSLSDIAAYFRIEDRLYAHWRQLFPDRILTVPYEGLVADPKAWTDRMLAHAGLTPEPQVYAPHQAGRPVSTASIAQVRAPISTARVGSAESYAPLMAEFKAAYYR